MIIYHAIPPFNYSEHQEFMSWDNDESVLYMIQRKFTGETSIWAMHISGSQSLPVPVDVKDYFITEIFDREPYDFANAFARSETPNNWYQQVLVLETIDVPEQSSFVLGALLVGIALIWKWWNAKKNN